MMANKSVPARGDGGGGDFWKTTTTNYCLGNISPVF